MINRIRACSIAIAGFLLGSTGTALAQGGKVVARYHRYWLPDQATAIAGKVDDMFNLILWLTSVVFVLVAVVMVYFLIRYRARPGGKAIFYHGNTRLEIIWTVIPALIVIALGFMSKDLWSQIKQQFPAENDALVIDVRPRQFQWDIRYAGADGKFNTADDITTINQLHVPAGKNVLIKLTAQDVIHSFFVPEFRVKQDAVPGMVTKTWFNVPKPGNFEIACAELCGLGHYRMRGYLTVHTQSDFDAWYSKQQSEKAAQLAPPPAAPAAAAPATPDSALVPPKGDTATHGTATGDSAGAKKTDTATRK
ncbi:MAG: cytochrome c oxidase subunit II [Candidatus Kapaibacterium sp.]